jgi:hypothetical protein
MLPFARGPNPMREGQHSAEAMKSPRRETVSLDYWPPRDEPVDDDNHGDNEQEVDKASTHVHDEEPKNPKDEQNYGDRPKHDGILARSELQLERQEMSQALRTALCSSERYGTADYARWQPTRLS